MKIPITRVKQFIAELKKECTLEFPNRLPATSLKEGEPTNSRMKDCNTALKEREVRAQFHSDMIKSDCKEPPCQCTLSLDACDFLSKKEIPHNEVEVHCDCGISIKLPVPMLLHAKEMKNIELDQHLIDEKFDYLFKSKLSVPSPD